MGHLSVTKCQTLRRIQRNKPDFPFTAVRETKLQREGSVKGSRTWFYGADKAGLGRNGGRVAKLVSDRKRNRLKWTKTAGGWGLEGGEREA